MSTDPGQTFRSTVDQLPTVDHHCHGVLRRDIDRTEFESLLTEAGEQAKPSGHSVFDSQVGFAVRRWCAPVLDLDPHAQPDGYLARRLELGHAEVTRRFLRAARIGTFLVDTGFVPESILEPDDLAEAAGGRAYEIVRLEQVAEQVMGDGVGAAEFEGAVRDRLALRTAQAAAVKSIAAYRFGLDLPGEPPSAAEIRGAAEVWLAEVAGGAVPRCASRVLHSFLIWAALDLGKPVQFHVGLGDSDADLIRGNPLLLTPLLRATQNLGVPIMLLHNYPFHRAAGYLAQVFGHVYVDVGLATHNVGRAAGRVIEEIMELSPFGKVLFSSDAFALPELFYLSAVLFRRGLAEVLLAAVHAGDWTTADAEQIATMIMAGNATAAYALDRDA